LPTSSERVLYCDHVENKVELLFGVACDNDLEGIVAKRRFDPYLTDQASWLKIRNTSYSQWGGREELFERERNSDPDFREWDDCTLACDKVA
jgi:ATP-dependent DNA ligase